MNATMLASETKAVPPVVSPIQDNPLAKIPGSRTNPHEANRGRAFRRGPFLLAVVT